MERKCRHYMNCVICNKPTERKSYWAKTCSDDCLSKLRSIHSRNLKLKRKEKPVKYINYYENEEDVVEKILETL